MVCGGVVYNHTVKKNIHGIRFPSVPAETWPEFHLKATPNTTCVGNDPVGEVQNGYLTSNVYFENSFAGNTKEARFDDSVSTQSFAPTWTLPKERLVC